MYLLPTDDDVATYRCTNLKLMAAKDIDPSLALGFFCQSRLDFDMLCNRIAELKEFGLPMLNVMMKRPNYDDLMGGFDDDDDEDEGMDGGNSSNAGNVSKGSNLGGSDDDDDDCDLDKFTDAMESPGSPPPQPRVTKDNDVGGSGDEFVML
jgi:hypothetical protein